MAANRYLTKSRFKVGYICPTKLAFHDDARFGNKNKDNKFLEALAEGGFQVSELAKVYYPGGVEITEIDNGKAAAQTADLLKNERVTIYEAAILTGGLFIKADIIIKNGKSVQLIEVKAKSFDSSVDDPFYRKSSLKKGTPALSSEWEPYIVDAAFQTHVFKRAFPAFNVSTSLLLADKCVKASVDGINQRFFIGKNETGRTSVKIAPGTTKETIGQPLLIKVCVDAEVRTAWEMNYAHAMTFDQAVAALEEICMKGSKYAPVVGSNCKTCEFRIGSDLKSKGLRSGFEDCWSNNTNAKEISAGLPLVFDIWNFRKSEKLIQDGIVLMSEVTEEDVSPAQKSGEVGLSSSQRQWLQIEKVKTGDSSSFIDRGGLKLEMDSWTYPLHFIDFETTMVAIPFHKGRRPYEQVAFQFSHHKLSEDGTLVHQTEYINFNRGKFPNFDFVRALKAALDSDDGTIFRYAAHENTVLNQIKSQLIDAQEPDADALIKFIESITNRPEENAKPWSGIRCMVDLCDLVKKYFYNPATGGSNSIKKVLPAILNESKMLKSKYSMPIYGSLNGIASKNFKDWTWIVFDKSGDAKDPYKLLPPIFSDIDLETMDSLILDGSIADGGAAMTAYARMQFSEMSDEEATRVASALLKYCELDTFAMVLIFEHWQNETKVSIKTAA